MPRANIYWRRAKHQDADGAIARLRVEKGRLRLMLARLRQMLAGLQQTVAPLQQMLAALRPGRSSNAANASPAGAELCSIHGFICWRGAAASQIPAKVSQILARASQIPAKASHILARASQIVATISGLPANARTNADRGSNHLHFIDSIFVVSRPNLVSSVHAARTTRSATSENIFAVMSRSVVLLRLTGERAKHRRDNPRRSNR